MARIEDIEVGAGSQRFTLAAGLIHFRAVRSSGPGGQNVNKVSSKVVLEFDFAASDLPFYAKEKLLSQASRINADGHFVVRCEESRDQSRNLEIALELLKKAVEEALHRPKLRQKTKPSRGQRQRRLNDKKMQSDKKTERRKRPE